MAAPLHQRYWESNLVIEHSISEHRCMVGYRWVLGKLDLTHWSHSIPLDSPHLQIALVPHALASRDYPFMLQSTYPVIVRIDMRFHSSS